MSNYVRNFGVKNYWNQTTIPQVIWVDFFSETRCTISLHHRLGGSPNPLYKPKRQAEEKWQISTPQGAKTS